LDTIIKIFHAITLWFNQHKRELPWRNIEDPYLVMVSEVMLQQTQVDVVIPYFLRWKERFPTIEDLAKAPIDEVFNLFAGLGYYSRAKGLHDAAKECVLKHEGKIPSEKKDLLALKGIGPYTASAILNFGFKKKAAAVDGNVLRVISRLLGSKEPIDKGSTRIKFESLIEEHLTDQNSPIVTEGLIEFGALICKKKPECQRCPIRQYCLAYQKQEVHLIPVKSKKMVQKKLLQTIYIYQYETSFYLTQKKEGEWNAGLYEFPNKAIDSIEVHQQEVDLKPFKTSITCHDITIQPKLVKVIDPKDKIFYSTEEIEKLSLSSAHKKLAFMLKKRIEKMD
jgi:A/G-specific adenine glycosylase